MFRRNPDLWQRKKLFRNKKEPRVINNRGNLCKAKFSRYIVMQSIKISCEHRFGAHKVYTDV